MAVLLLTGCVQSDSGDFRSGDGYSASGININPGSTAIVGLGTLDLVGDSDTATITELELVGQSASGASARVLGVKVYSLDESGGIGAIREADLAGSEGQPGWTLEPSTHAVVRRGQPTGIAVVVRGDTVGHWSSQSLIVHYKVDGDLRQQEMPIGAFVCVVDGPVAEPTCEQ